MISTYSSCLIFVQVPTPTGSFSSPRSGSKANSVNFVGTMGLDSSSPGGSSTAVGRNNGYNGFNSVTSLPNSTAAAAAGRRFQPGPGPVPAQAPPLTAAERRARFQRRLSRELANSQLENCDCKRCITRAMSNPEKALNSVSREGRKDGRMDVVQGRK